MARFKESDITQGQFLVLGAPGVYAHI